MIETLLPGVSHLQNIHPLVVHFPIAFLIGSAVFYLLAAGFRKESLAMTAFSLLIAGTLAAAAAVGTGLYAEGGVMVSHGVREELLSVHKRCMIATLAVSAALSLWAVAERPFPGRGRAVFLLLFVLMLTLMSFGADYGARMGVRYKAGPSMWGCPSWAPWRCSSSAAG
jgi:uncharacterized membrane protein